MRENLSNLVYEMCTSYSFWWLILVMVTQFKWCILIQKLIFPYEICNQWKKWKMILEWSKWWLRLIFKYWQVTLLNPISLTCSDETSYVSVWLICQPKFMLELTQIMYLLRIRKTNCKRPCILGFLSNLHLSTWRPPSSSICGFIFVVSSKRGT